VLLDDLPSIAVQLDELRESGVRIAIDDFGTGYTSLAHLRHLPVDQIKIDRSFTSQLPSGRDSSLVRMMTELGHRLGVTIVAQGVDVRSAQRDPRRGLRLGAGIPDRPATHTRRGERLARSRR